MANTTISPNMKLPVPTAGQDPGPDWATNMVACLGATGGAIDGHDHTTNKGVPITPAGLNVNADLPLNGNNLTLARTVRFSSQGVAIPSSSPDVGCAYEVLGELYYNDAAGNQVQITKNGSVTGSTGTITGLPSGTASASFAAGTFTFDSATNTPATMAVGPLVIGAASVNPKTVTLGPSGSQAANYSLVFPTALPASQSAVVSDASGNLTFLAQEGSFYTPTLTATAGTSAAALSNWLYVRSGLIVYVSGWFTIVVDGSNTASFTATLPILPASSFGNAFQVIGTLGNAPLLTGGGFANVPTVLKLTSTSGAKTARIDIAYGSAPPTLQMTAIFSYNLS